MPKYRVLVTRQRCITEWCVVAVGSRGDKYVQKDALIKSDGLAANDWTEDAQTVVSHTCDHVQEIA